VKARSEAVKDSAGEDLQICEVIENAHLKSLSEIDVLEKGYT
jgi:hypothetical protein